MLINSFTFHKYRIFILNDGDSAKIDDFHKKNKHPLQKPKGPNHSEAVSPFYEFYFISR